MEAALRESEAQLTEAQRIAHIGSWHLDIVNDVLVWSDEIYRIFEIDPEKFGASYEAFLDAIHPDDREAVNLAYTNSLRTRTPYTIDHRLQFADGRIKYVHEQCETFYDTDGKPVRSVGVVQDITERKRAEEALRESETKFRAVFENSVDAIGVSKTGLHTFVNPAYLALFGYADNAELAGKPILDLIAPSHREQVLENVRRRASGQPTPAVYETRGLRKDGSEFDMDVHVSTYELNGEVYTVPIIRDITERRQADDALKRRKDELERFERLTIGRELKMVELKKRISELETNLLGKE
jgi:PAS domain S-box-containing protein